MIKLCLFCSSIIGAVYCFYRIICSFQGYDGQRAGDENKLQRLDLSPNVCPHCGNPVIIAWNWRGSGYTIKCNAPGHSALWFCANDNIEFVVKQWNIYSDETDHVLPEIGTLSWKHRIRKLQ